MLLAQLHRKVPSEFEGMEDVLTSNTFGLFRYLPTQLACELLAEFADIPLPQDPPNLKLWPRYPTPPGFRGLIDTAKAEVSIKRGDTEPDVVITTEDWLILVEAKYRSPLDDAYDQLGREFVIGYQLAQVENRHFKLLVVTAHAQQPTPAGIDLKAGLKNALAAASTGLGDEAAEMIAAVPTSLCWSNWQHLYKILLTTHDKSNTPNNVQRLLEDVCLLLELRGLKPYDSRPMVRALDKWTEAGIPDELWSLPVAYYNLVTHLGDFQLDSLSDLEWRPLKKSGD